MAELLVRRYSAKTHIGPFVVVGPQPTGYVILNVFNRFEQAMCQPIVSYGPFVTLNIGILLRITRLDKV